MVQKSFATKKMVRNKFWIKIFKSRQNLVIKNVSKKKLEEKIYLKKSWKKLVHKNYNKEEKIV